MKSDLLRSLAVMAALTASGHAVTINWGSEAFSSLVDSNGNVLGSSFHFELGAFAPPPTNPSWVPSAGNERCHLTLQRSERRGFGAESWCA
jgi:hypothetical protein